MKITISKTSIKQYSKKKDIATTVKIVFEVGNNALKPILDDLVNNTIVKRLELECLPELFPVNNSLKELIIRNPTTQPIYFGTNVHLLSNLESLHLECARLLEYDPFTDKLNHLTNLRHLHMKINGSFYCSNIRLTNLASLTILEQDFDYCSINKI